jgi:hypothetical protein
MSKGILLGLAHTLSNITEDIIKDATRRPRILT